MTAAQKLEQNENWIRDSVRRGDVDFLRCLQLRHARLSARLTPAVKPKFRARKYHAQRAMRNLKLQYA